MVWTSTRVVLAEATVVVDDPGCSTEVGDALPTPFLGQSSAFFVVHGPQLSYGYGANGGWMLRWKQPASNLLRVACGCRKLGRGR